MKTKHVLIVGLAALSLAAVTAVVQPGRGEAQRPDGSGASLVGPVRAATERFKSVDAAKAAGYGLFHGCVSGPQEGRWASTSSTATWSATAHSTRRARRR